jgi:tetratricopeptide (TPR) repeat protein
MRWFDSMRDITQCLSSRVPGGTDFLLALAAYYTLLADVQSDLACFEQARGLYQQALVIEEHLVITAPDNDKCVLSLSNGCARLGRTLSALRQVHPAFALFERSRAIAEEGLSRHPDDVDFARNLAWRYIDGAVMQRRCGDAVAELALYGQCRGIVERMAALTPDNIDLAALQCVCYAQLAEVNSRQHKLTLAVDWYQQARSTAKRLAAGQPQSDWNLRKLSEICEGLGSVLLLAGDRAAARDHFLRGVALADRLVAEDPGDLHAPWLVAVSCSRLAAITEGAEHVQWDEKDWAHRIMMTKNFELLSRFYEEHLVVHKTRLDQNYALNRLQTDFCIKEHHDN